MMCPEWALVGTVAIRPAAALCRCAAGEVLEMRAPAVRGKATIIPVFSPLPVNSSVPRVETWCGLALHLGVGTQLALVMRTEVTCRLETPFVPDVGAAPPAVLAVAAPGLKADAHASNPTTAALRDFDRLWAPVLAKMIPFDPVTSHDGQACSGTEWAGADLYARPTLMAM